MKLTSLTLHGFKSFAHSTELVFDMPLVAIVGPNGSGKSNVVEAIRFALGEQSMKSLRGGSGSDLIFKGSSAIRPLSRASVSLTFDNSDRVFSLSTIDSSKLSIDFDEVTISREVYADGQNVYSINGHEVRLKDIMELIASVNIGASGHHIISQGEADRLLNANPRERRHMLEDALGLKVYQYRIKESERKLDKTREMLKDATSLRREIAPHLVFLKKQVEKIERAATLRTELLERYYGYLSTQESYVRMTHDDAHKDYEKINYELVELRKQLDSYRAQTSTTTTSPQVQELSRISSDLARVRETKESLMRKSGHVEGSLEAMKLQIESYTKVAPESKAKSTREYTIIWSSVVRLCNDIESLCDTALGSDEMMNIKNTVMSLRDSVRTFRTESDPAAVSAPAVAPERDASHEDMLHMRISELEAEYHTVRDAIASCLDQEEQLRIRDAALRIELEEEQTTKHEEERAMYALGVKEKELESQLTLATMRLDTATDSQRMLQEQIDEAVVLLGDAVWTYKESIPWHDFVAERNTLDMGAVTARLEDERRVIERLKIKIEDVGGGSGADVIQEYNDTLERDRFLEREITDLETTIQSLDVLIQEVTAQLRVEFTQGIEKINGAFGQFFQTMFGGGEAHIALVSLVTRKRKSADSEDEEEIPDDMDLDEEDDTSPKEEGIDIRVQLPRKRVQDLAMLSGGERSLTSIALLFALSQVNPPPFLVLDETDAALDEANSRRYGDMIQNLAKISQLIVVTHNRETMSRADVLYGVTLGLDNSSQLLSVKFDDALQYAK